MSPEQLKQIGSLSPHNRLAEAEEIASVVNFVAGPEASWVNGQNLPVNGVCFSSIIKMVEIFAQLTFFLPPGLGRVIW